MIGNITPTLPEKLVGYLRPGAPALGALSPPLPDSPHIPQRHHRPVLLA